MKPVEHARRIRKRRWQEALTKTQAKAHQFFVPRFLEPQPLGCLPLLQNYLASDLRASDYITSPHASIGRGNKQRQDV